MHVYNLVDYKIIILFLNKVNIAQWCLTLCDPMNCSLPGSSVHRIFQVRILEWVAAAFSQGTFPTQGSNPGLPNCRQILYQLSYWSK